MMIRHWQFDGIHNSDTCWKCLALCGYWICDMEASRSIGSLVHKIIFIHCSKSDVVYPIYLVFFLYSEWVLGTREDLVKDIVAELRPDLGEVRPN